jgi:hypothetical protein
MACWDRSRDRVGNCTNPAGPCLPMVATGAD